MRLSYWRRIGYGSAETGVTACEFIIQLLLLKFYTDVAGLSPWLAGLALGIATVWDAFTDPVIGILSDRATFRSGRRRPFIAVGAIILAVSFYFLFTPPIDGTPTHIFLYLMFGYMIVNTGMSLISVPHLALAADLTQSLEERTSLFGWRFLFANVGLLAGILLPTLFSQDDSAIDPDNVQATTLALGGILILGVIFALFATASLDHAQKSSVKIAFTPLKGLKTILRNKPYNWLLTSYAFGSIGRTVNASLALYYYQHFLELSERVVFVYILIPFTLTLSLSIIFWTLISRRIGKQRAFLIGVTFLGVTTSFVYLIFPANNWLYPAIYGAVAGFAIGAVFLLDAMVSDASDYERIFTGDRKEGVYFGIWRLDAKLSRAVGLALSGLALEWIGFDAKATTQTEETQWGLAILFGPVVGAIFLISVLIQSYCPINLEKEKQINRIVNRRKAQGRGK